MEFRRDIWHQKTTVPVLSPFLAALWWVTLHIRVSQTTTYDRRRQTPTTVTSLAPTQCVGGPVITQTDHVWAWEAHSATGTFYSATFIVLCIIAADSAIAPRACNAMGVINRRPYDHPCWCQLDRNCDHQISTTNRVVDYIVYSSACAPSRTQTTVADGHIFGGKASEPETSRPIGKRNFHLPHLHLASSLGWSHRNFVEIFCVIKIDPLAIVRRCLRDPNVWQFWYSLGLWQTDGQTDKRWQLILRWHSVARPKIASLNTWKSHQNRRTARVYPHRSRR